MKKILKVALALMMALTIQMTTLQSAKAMEIDLSQPGTYEVPIASLVSAAPLQPVQQAFAKAFGDSVVVDVDEAGNQVATINLQHMVIENFMGGNYHANVVYVDGATVVSQGQEVYSANFGTPDNHVEITVPKTVTLPLNLDENNSQVITINVDFMDAFLGSGSAYDTNVTLTLDIDSATMKADYSGVTSAIASANALVASDYSEKSWAALQAAINEVVYDLDASHQDDVDAMALAINDAIAALEKVYSDSKLTTDGTYTVNVQLWHATEDRASMAAQSLETTATIVKENGQATMYITTKEMTFGTIKACLQELYLGNETSDYHNNPATVEARDANGNPTMWSFVLPHENEYIDVMVNPHVAMMGNMDLGARIKVDYTTLTKVSDATSKPEAPETTVDDSNTEASNNDITSTDATTSAVKTGDNAHFELMGGLLICSLAAIAFITRKKLCK